MTRGSYVIVCDMINHVPLFHSSIGHSEGYDLSSHLYLPRPRYLSILSFLSYYYCLSLSSLA